MIDESPRDEPPDVEIRFPAAFRDLPLSDDPAEWQSSADHFLDLVPVERPAAHRELALAHLRAYSQLLRSGGVVRAAAGLTILDGGALTTASLMLSWQRAEPAAPADVAAMGLLAALTERYPDREVYGIELPIGPAVAVIAERTLSGTETSGEPVEILVRSIEVSVPMDGLPWLLVVALSSPTPVGWDAHQELMAKVCRSLCLANQPPRSSAGWPANTATY